MACAQTISMHFGTLRVLLLQGTVRAISFFLLGETSQYQQQHCQHLLKDLQGKAGSIGLCMPSK